MLGLAGVIWLLFLLGHLYLIGVQLCEDQRPKHHKNTRREEIRLHPQISITTPHLMVNKIGRSYVFSREIN